VEGVAGRQIFLEDPAGNPIELFEYYKDYEQYKQE
jgi:extradiol dioxygenase family protein